MLPSWLTGKSVAKLRSILNSGGGGGGSTVSVSPTALTGNEVGTITVNGVTKTFKSGEVGDSVEVTQVQESGTKIATITVNETGTDIYAPSTTGQVQADWSESDTTDPSYIQNKPTIPAGIPSGGTTGQVLTKESGTDYDASWVTPSGGGGTQVQADWTESDTSDPSYIQNKPSLATVATSGSYNDLSNKPTIPSVSVTQIQESGSKIATITVDGSDTDIYAPSATGQVQADWSETDTSDPSYIQNKPTLATVATSGSYNDLSNKPTIPAAQTQADWSETDTSDPSYIQNKPSLAAVATSGSYNDLSNKPTIPAAQVQADWSETDSSDPSYIQNKPSLENDYSTSQKIIGTWIDGRTLYQKTISFGSLPNATKKTVAHNISNMKECVYVQAIGKGSDNSWYPIPSVIGNSPDQNILVSVSNTAIEINTFADWSGVATTYVTLRYTKTS